MAGGRVSLHDIDVLVLFWGGGVPRGLDGTDARRQVAQTDAFVGSDDDTVFSEAEKVMLLWQIVHEILADENEFEGKFVCFFRASRAM